MPFKFEVALSYVNAQQELAARVSSTLRQRGMTVFFDRVDVEAIVGRDGPDALTDVYTTQARVCVMLLSPAYDESAWTRIEREAVLARRMVDRTAFLIPVRVEGEPPAWLPRQLLYFDLLRQSVDELCEVVVKRVQRVSGAARAVPELLTSVTVGIGTFKNEIVADGDWLYVPTAGTTHNEPDLRDGIACLRASDLSEAWHARTHHDANAMLQVGSLLYVGTDAGTIECIDASTGKECWPEPPRLSAPVLAQPIVTPTGVLACAVDGMAVLLDAANGTILAKTQIEGGIVGDPLVMDDRVLFATQAGWAVEAPLNDPLRWTSDPAAPDVRRVQVKRAGYGGSEYPCWFSASPVRLEGTIFLPHSRETTLPGIPVAALERRRFQVRYTIAETDRPDETFGNVRARPVIVDGLVIVPAAYSNLTVAFDRDGGVVWAEPCGWPAFPQYGSPGAFGQAALVPRFDGALHAIDAQTGQRAWSIALGIERHFGQVFYADQALPGQEDDPWWEAEGRVPLNAPVTVVGDTAFLVDAAGTLHAVGLPNPG
ncbi:MAG TPA: PQQ-binding-like beta-propeller repeat protein [Candidatus Baltobacteraceae bacterium]|nr:PQQ-binding-like beta-propeller repeat protein [Candidatus Baltobacteraceae bacterium]